MELTQRLYGGVLDQAAACRRPLHVLLGWPGPVTHRQHLAWQEHERRAWNRPSRTDHYLMLLDQRVAHVLSSKGGRLRPGDSKLTFGRPRPAEETDPSKMTPEQIARATALCKMRVGSMFGVALPGAASPLSPDGGRDHSEDWDDGGTD